ncbi:MAG: flagellar basal body P-ring protein FlgI [Candidatus Margulisbacteria bacterium]|nr:flagellar basal body P-ring protein FlgI [Candidatus Margulisiibacteriota bacterium]
MRKVVTLVLFLSLSFLFAMTSRVKELIYLEDARPNLVMGYGLIVGLKNTGDSPQIMLTQKSMKNLLNKMGLSSEERDIQGRNMASVMVTAELPPYARNGQKIDVNVSSIGDAVSLRGGTLLLTPLVGADSKTYITAQGNIVVGGISAESGEVRYQKNESNRGIISDGGIVEKEVPIKLANEQYLVLNLKKPDFITAARIGLAIEESGLAYCEKTDPAAVKVRLTPEHKKDMVDFIAKLMDVPVEPDISAKIVISERTGAIVIGEKVRIAPVAINYGDINIKIDRDIYDVVNINVSEAKTNFKVVQNGDTLSDLVKSLNALGAKPSTMISILQAIKASGAITAEIEVI